MQPGTRIGPYEVQVKLGAGGMGEVYRARDTQLDRDVALKILPPSFAGDPERLMRFEREAKTLASLNHPNIAAIYGLGASGDEGDRSGSRALVMELVEGEDLSEIIARGALALPDALPIARQVAEALEAAHEAGIVHRDLKPANIKVRSDGTVKVLDFGLAKAMTSVADSARLTGADASRTLDPGPTMTSPAMTAIGMVMGTAAYMSPEQARGKAIDRRADVWAFGCVLYEMLTGRRAFDGAVVSDVIASVLRDTPDFLQLPATTPESIRRLLQRCLEKDPRDRLGDMSAARLEIRDARQISQAPLSGVAAAASPLRIGTRATLLVAGAGVVAGAIAALAFWPRSAPAEGLTVRFPLVSDSTLSVNTSMTQPFAVSPNGQSVVFVGDRGQGPRLWVREADKSEPRVLEDTAGGLQPSISPNGEWVAFIVANHVIRKIRLSGGAASTIISLDDVSAALAWLSDDELVFEKIGSRSGIHRVSANGGEASLLVPIDTAAGETAQRRPFVLGKERRLFYTRSTEGAPSSLAVLALDDGRRSQINLPAVQTIGVVDGHLVYSRADGALMAVPFDLGGMRATGEARELTDRVLRTGTGTAVAMSESGTLVFGSAQLQTGRLMTAQTSGGSVAIGSRVLPYEVPRFSPAGDRVAVAVTDGDNRDLWVLDRATGESTRVTRGGRDTPVGWSSNGRALIFLRDGQVWTAPVDGSAESRKLVQVRGSVQSAAVVSSDGSLVIVRQNQADLSGMFRVSSETGAEVTIFKAASARLPRPLEPRVSPDGKWVAYEDRNEQQLHVHALEGTATLQVSDQGGTLPMWGKDSSQLFYQAPGGLTVVELQTIPSLAVRSRRRVSETTSHSTVKDVASDGRTFLIFEPATGGPRAMVVLGWADEVRRQLRSVGSQRERSP